MPTIVLGENAITIPSGTTAQRPSDAQGLVRYNTINGLLEYNSFGFWITNQNAYTRIDGKTKVFFDYIGNADRTWTVPTGITYIFVKMWGAGGGGGQYGGWRQGGHGGGGGYSEGILSVLGGQVVTMRVGQAGWDAPGISTAWPNGGAAAISSAGDNRYGGNGGGSSSIRVPNLNSNNWCMFAGGGGGAGACTSFAVNSGGAGGGLTGESGKLSNGFTVIGNVGKGGTQTAGGEAGAGTVTTGGAGSANQGGSHQYANPYAGGGGGGYFGGGSGSYTNGNSMAGGGGGSGYIHSGVLCGSTQGGSGQDPALISDPDRTNNSYNQGIAYGGYEGAQGGNGLIVIYY